MGNSANVQLNHFSNLDFDDIHSDSKKDAIRAFKRVTFNTLSSNDYLTNEAYKTLRTNLFFCGKNVKSIVLTSCDENEGKSTVSTELVKSLAESGKKTLLIDADMRKSMLLRKSIRAGEVEGLSELLSGMTELDDVIFHTQNANFDAIFSGHFPPNPVELLGNGRLQEVLDELKNRYEYIIIDSPPLGIVIDAAVIAAVCDGAIMVVSNGKISRNTARNVKAQLEKSGCRLLGAVLNETEKTKYYKKAYEKKYYHQD